MRDLSRRRMLRFGGALGAAALVPVATVDVAAKELPNRYSFFDPWEGGFIEAAVDRLIPPDPLWPGAKDAGIPVYLDRQLVGAYGQGERMYRQGPWKGGTPQQGYQLQLTPAELYRASLRRLRALAEDFSSRDDVRQDALLRELEEGRHDLGGFSSAIFFETLLANTIEGFFADPVYGGNRDKAGWRMIGFPGAHAAYLGIYTLHGINIDATPVGMDAGQAVSPQHSHPKHQR